MEEKQLSLPLNQNLLPNHRQKKNPQNRNPLKPLLHLKENRNLKFLLTKLLLNVNNN
jgi:hypothetical protein